MEREAELGLELFSETLARRYGRFHRVGGKKAGAADRSETSPHADDAVVPAMVDFLLETGTYVVTNHYGTALFDL